MFGNLSSYNWDFWNGPLEAEWPQDERMTIWVGLMQPLILPTKSVSPDFELQSRYFANLS